MSSEPSTTNSVGPSARRFSRILPAVAFGLALAGTVFDGLANGSGLVAVGFGIVRIAAWTVAGVAVAYALELLAESAERTTSDSEPSQALLERLDALVAAVERMGSEPAKGLAGLSTEELEKRLAEAKDGQDLDSILDIRVVLDERLDDGRLRALDNELVPWFAVRFQESLLAGQAELIVETMVRMVDLFEGHPSAQPIREALPMIQQSIEIRASVRRDRNGSD